MRNSIRKDNERTGNPQKLYCAFFHLFFTNAFNLLQMQRKSFSPRLITQLAFALFVLRLDCAGTQGNPRVMYSMNPNFLDYTDSPFIVTELPARPRKGLTVCAWISLTYFRRPTVVFSVEDVDSNLGQISVALLPNALLLKEKEHISVILSEVVLQSWNHLCLSVSPKSLSLYHMDRRVYSNATANRGKIENTLKLFAGGGVPWPEVQPMTVGFPSNNELMFIVDKPPIGSFAGRIFSPQIYEDVLPEASVLKLTKCINISDPILDPSWTAIGKNISTEPSVPWNAPCAEINFSYLLLPEALSFEGNRQMCRHLHMNLLSPENSRDHNILVEDLKSQGSSCVREPWYAWVRPPEERKVCEALIDSGRETLPCDGALCAGCQITNPRRIFIMKGLCALKEADLSFVIARSPESSGFAFLGLEKYSVVREKNQWFLNDRTTGGTIASTASDTAVGVNDWTLKAPFCGRVMDEIVRVSLTACNSTESFCNNGDCIAISQRCNFYPDCADASDETNCTNVIVPSGYQITQPPPPTPTKVMVSFNILRVLSLPPQGLLTLLIEADLTWVDSRIRIANLPPDSNSHLQNSSMLWKPKLEVFCPDIRKSLKFSELDSGSLAAAEVNSLWAKVSGPSLPNLRQSLFNDVVYDGSNVTFTLSQLITLKLDCFFDFTFFPFDQQLCQVTFILTPWSYEYIKVERNLLQARYTGPQRLLQYTVEDAAIEKTTVEMGSVIYSGVVMSVHLARRPSLFILNIYLPTTLLSIVSCATLWMTGENGGGTPFRIQISCVICVIYILMWIMLESSTPISGHSMAIHVWLFFCTFHSILHVSVHVMMDVFCGYGRPDPFSTMGSRANSSRVRELKPPVDANNFYNGFFHKMKEEHSIADAWSVPYWILFIARVVSPAMLIFFTCAYWPYVLYFSKR